MCRAVKRVLNYYALKWAMSKRAPDAVPGTGDARRRNDYIVAFIGLPRREIFDIAGSELFVDSVDRKSVNGRLRRESDDRFRIPCAVPVGCLGEMVLSYRRFYQGDIFDYRNSLAMLLSEVTCYPLTRMVLERVAQDWFDRKSLVRLKRMEVLKELHAHRVRERVESRLSAFPHEEGLSAMDLLERRYGYRIFSHAGFDPNERELDLLLRSLVCSGDVLNQQSRFSATDKALVTLDRFEQDEERHRDQSRIGWGVVGLTTVIALAAAAQVVLKLLMESPAGK